MQNCVRVELAKAQKIKQELIEGEALDHKYNVLQEEKYIYFPVTEKYQGKTVKKEVKPRTRKLSAQPFKEVLKEILNEEELEQAKTAYEVVGTIAIMEVPDVLEDKAKQIGEALLKSNPLLKTVVKKSSKHDGVYRTQKMTVLAGDNTKVAMYKENNCNITLDVEQVYFSARLSTERKRISEQVKKDEDILVMFSGAAPYPCILSKNTKAKEIIGIEINPKGHEYGLQNIKQNKNTNVKLFCGDVRSIAPQLHKTFDRIIMPLPKTAEEFLDITLPLAKKGCTIHMYAFYHEDEFKRATAEIDKYCKQQEREYKILKIVKCGQHAPRTYRICVDFEVLN